MAVPAAAPDSVNTVIVLELKQKPVTDSLFFLSNNIALTRLLAFDATQHGGGFSYGDGKTDRFYVEGWKKTDQFLSWDFRTDQPASFKMIIKCIVPENAGGTYEVQLDSFKFKQMITGERDSKALSMQLQVVKLGAGVHQLAIRPVRISTELMKLLEIDLIKE